MTETLARADIDLIQRILPHRYPFLLVDRVIDIDGTKSGVGIKNVTMNEPQFTGHFPGMPVFPGVLMVEALAQTAAVIAGVGLDLAGKNFGVYFMAMESVKFRRKVIPGDTLRMEVETLRGGGKVWKFKGRATVEGEVACECEFTAMMDLPK
ncbi:3-hydroxyacyl-ACP dehydratase FabZ [Boseongicola aestuarii]|uniref:3-hydroxyacyl-[acyl-carrier-protein] dehydratase FabZ n=1 Tax=Boseongicola aestuarii TaxID=1470561 RepID=A0A238IV67_9RHOB|nr:3-hydroxyacyl-ACP dehydratase FabZ [Boseongicola aestuarii]SMX22247.1 3-hydroxyacyl-[acyl-carrier-protein] dehydratase FabZ [Boseongicola aestuarii]